ncbi:MAG: hypothetical protein JW929_08050 [Anaerolineales bacterium]|nr:hypothetical protein [Anaerolineales bacterium]
MHNADPWEILTRPDNPLSPLAPGALIGILLGAAMLILEGFAALWLFLTGCLTIQLVRKTRMDLSADGLTFRFPGAVMTTGWENVQGVKAKKYFFGLREYEALVLAEPTRQTLAWWFPFWSRQPVREIPLSMFPDWRERELGAAARRYAPGILENGKG